jgi:hypothetical protein
MKKLNKLSKLKCLLFAALALLMWSSCKTDKITPINEPVKDISGSWKIIKATRNGSDLTALVDSNIYSFSKFRISFSGSNYTVTNPLPFIVSVNGTYSLDNPQYPFTIYFTPTGTKTAVSTAFTYPIVDGQRVLTLVFYPGCPQNTYSYSLVKVSN